MPKDHARKNRLAEYKTLLGIKHVDAIALLDHPNPEERALLVDLICEYEDVSTYRQAIALLTELRNDPANRMLCTTCGWSYAMICPECAGCGCDFECTGWRHREYGGGEDGEESEWEDFCDGCGAEGYEPCHC